MSFNEDQIREEGLKSLEKKEKQKAYDKWYLAKARHELKEMKRIIRENGLENQIQSFTDNKEDYA